MSFGLCERIWRVLDDHLNHLLLMMSDCPLAIRHKKGEYIWIGVFVVKGRFLLFWSCEIKILFCFTCIFHTCVYVFVKCYRNIQVDSIVLLSTLATDR